MKISDAASFLGRVQAMAGDVEVELPTIPAGADATGLAADVRLNGTGNPSGNGVTVTYEAPAPEPAPTDQSPTDQAATTDPGSQG